MGVGLAFAVEIAQQLLLLGVHADDWKASAQILPLQAGDVLELGVAIGIARAHCLLLQCLSLAVLMFAEQLGHDISTDRRSQRSDSERDLFPRQVRPFHIGRIGSPAVWSRSTLKKFGSRAASTSISFFRPPPFFGPDWCPSRLLLRVLPTP